MHDLWVRLRVLPVQVFPDVLGQRLYRVHPFQRRAEGFIHRDDDGALVGRLVGHDETEKLSIGEVIGRVYHLVEGELEISRGQGLPVAPLQVIAQGKGESQVVVGDGPLLGHVGDQVQGLGVAAHQPTGVDHTLVAGRGRIGGQVGVEADGIGRGGLGEIAALRGRGGGLGPLGAAGGDGYEDYDRQG